MISIQNLQKSYGSLEVLKDVSLEFPEGSVIGIVGENGAGKTTMFRCLAQLESYKGKIVSDHKHLKNHIGFLPTEPYFFPKLTGKEYLKLLFDARAHKSPDFGEKNIFELPLDQYASTYSTGMKKKLALMGIMLLQNDIYILDEPFNGVDIQSNMIITSMIKELKNMNKTVILSSHIFATLRDTCDSMYLLREGRVVKSAEKHSFGEIEAEMMGSEKLAESGKNFFSE